MRMKFAMKRRGLLTACNTVAGAVPESLSAANFAVLEGGDLIVPFGDFPQVVLLRGKNLQDAKASGMRVGPDGRAVVIQRVDAEAGNAMAKELSSLLGQARRFFLGVPVYSGHPFHPDPAKRVEYQDKRAFGWIKAVSNEADAVRMEVRWNALGLEAVNDGHLAYHSPQWEMVKVGVENGMGIYRPSRLTSSGLTNEPNIPVPALVAANIAAMQSAEGESEALSLLDQAEALLAEAERADFAPLRDALEDVLKGGEDGLEARLATLRDQIPALARGVSESPAMVAAWETILGTAAANGLLSEFLPGDLDLPGGGQDPAPEEGADMLKKLLDALIAAGIVAATDNEDEVLVKLASLKEDLQYRREDAARQKARADQLRSALPAANVAEIDGDALSDELITAAANEVTTLRGEVVTNAQQRDLYRGALASVMVDGLLAANAITGADAERIEQELFALPDTKAMQARRDELAARQSTVAANERVTVGLTKQTLVSANDRDQRKLQRQELVNKHLNRIAKGGAATQAQVTAAWAAARAESPELFN